MNLAVVYLARNIVAFGVVCYDIVGNKVISLFKEEIVKLLSWLNVPKFNGLYWRLFAIDLN